MKNCSVCGLAVEDGVNFCPKCGSNTFVQSAQQPQTAPATKDSGLKTAAKVFMVIGTVVLGLCTWIALAWCLPMTIIYFDKVKKGEPVGTGFKVCCLLFVSLIAGIIMLCDNEN